MIFLGVRLGGRRHQGGQQERGQRPGCPGQPVSQFEGRHHRHVQEEADHDFVPVGHEERRDVINLHLDAVVKKLLHGLPVKQAGRKPKLRTDAARANHREDEIENESQSVGTDQARQPIAMTQEEEYHQHVGNRGSHGDQVLQIHALQSAENSLEYTEAALPDHQNEKTDQCEPSLGVVLWGDLEQVQEGSRKNHSHQREHSHEEQHGEESGVHGAIQPLKVAGGVIPGNVFDHRRSYAQINYCKVADENTQEGPDPKALIT